VKLPHSVGLLLVLGRPQASHSGGDDRQRPTLPGKRVQTQVQLILTRGQPPPGDGLEQLEIDVVMRHPMCSMSREPFFDECTIYTARAPDDVVMERV
jgi:hypothetical protein